MTWRTTRNRLRWDPESRRHVLASDARIAVAKNVSRLRAARRWSQAELAEKVGTKQPNISAIETADVNLTIDSLAGLANALGTDIPGLFRERGVLPRVEGWASSAMFPGRRAQEHFVVELDALVGSETLSHDWSDSTANWPGPKRIYRRRPSSDLLYDVREAHFHGS